MPDFAYTDLLPLGPDETPLQAGLMFAVRLDKAVDFVGRDALLRAQGRPLDKKLLRDVRRIWMQGQSGS